jgi:hypothetical protein
MPFVNAQQSDVFAGAINYTGYTKSFSRDATVEVLDVTTLANTAKTYIVGQQTSTMSIGLFMDAAVVAHAATWETTTPQPVTYCPNGMLITAECMLADALLTQWSTSAPVGGVVEMSISTQNTGPLGGAGVVIGAFGAITTTTNGTAVNNGAATSTGAVAHVHSTAFSGLTSNTITIQDSADGSTGWTTIGTFTAITGTTYQRITIAGTVRQYTRVVDTCVGVGSNTRIVVLARL